VLPFPPSSPEQIPAKRVLRTTTPASVPSSTAVELHGPTTGVRPLRAPLGEGNTCHCSGDRRCTARGRKMPMLPSARVLNIFFRGFSWPQRSWVILMYMWLQFQRARYPIAGWYEPRRCRRGIQNLHAAIRWQGQVGCSGSHQQRHSRPGSLMAPIIHVCLQRLHDRLRPSPLVRPDRWRRVLQEAHDRGKDDCRRKEGLDYRIWRAWRKPGGAGHVLEGNSTLVGLAGLDREICILWRFWGCSYSGRSVVADRKGLQRLDGSLASKGGGGWVLFWGGVYIPRVFLFSPPYRRRRVRMELYIQSVQKFVTYTLARISLLGVIDFPACPWSFVLCWFLRARVPASCDIGFASWSFCRKL